MDPLLELALLLVGGPLSLGAGAYAWMRRHPEERAARRRARKLRRSPRRRVAEVDEGQRVRLAGEVALTDHEFRAPITGRPCVAWRVIVQTSGSDWETLADEVGATDFLLDDGSGVARVEGVGLDLQLEPDAGGSADTYTSVVPPGLEDFCASRNIATTDELGLPRGLQYQEAVLGEGAHVTVAGKSSWAIDPRAQRGYRGVERQLRIGPLRDGRIYLKVETPRKRET